METTPFTIERTLNAPVGRVWAAISDKDEMKNWYFDLSEFKAEKGFRFEFDSGSAAKTYTHVCEILEVIPEEKLVYSWSYRGYEGFSVVTFELFPEGEKTRLKLTHEGLESFPKDNPDMARESFATGWTSIIGKSLPAYVEK